MYADIFGPYLRKDGRKHIVLKFDDGTRATISYPKWLMELKLGRMLVNDETVDHKNRDFTDDRIENLVIKPRVAHAKEDARRVKKVKLTCVWCEKVFKRKEPSQINYNARSGKAGPFCGARCRGQYGAAVQNGKISKLPPQKQVKPKYYQLAKS